jgi:hypothetical protein
MSEEEPSLMPKETPSLHAMTSPDATDDMQSWVFNHLPLTAKQKLGLVTALRAERDLLFQQKENEELKTYESKDELSESDTESSSPSAKQHKHAVLDEQDRYSLSEEMLALHPRLPSDHCQDC